MGWLTGKIATMIAVPVAIIALLFAAIEFGQIHGLPLPLIGWSGYLQDIAKLNDRIDNPDTGLLRKIANRDADLRVVRGQRDTCNTSVKALGDQGVAATAAAQAAADQAKAAADKARRAADALAHRPVVATTPVDLCSEGGQLLYDGIKK